VYFEYTDVETENKAKLQERSMETAAHAPVSFTKMSGHGNDFIIVDNTAKVYSADWAETARRWCPRRTGIGADGLLVISPGKRGDFELRIFNRDGSEAEMCGNGARCAAAFAAHHHIAGTEMVFETLAGMIMARINDEEVAIRLTDSVVMGEERILIREKGNEFPVYFINTGVPHAIVFTDTIRGSGEFNARLHEYPSSLIASVGRTLRFHEAFKPAGTNVDLVEVTGPGEIYVRTYERGVEEETLACGTGAVAAAIISHLYKNIGAPPVSVHMPGGTLTVDFIKNDTYVKGIWLKGKVELIYRGNVFQQEDVIT
jgi:diaminopimelate epimerase